MELREKIDLNAWQKVAIIYALEHVLEKGKLNKKDGTELISIVDTADVIRCIGAQLIEVEKRGKINERVEPAGQHIFYCEKRAKCKWQFALPKGVGWGEIPPLYPDGWRDWHDKMCGGKLIHGRFLLMQQPNTTAPPSEGHNEKEDVMKLFRRDNTEGYTEEQLEALNKEWETLAQSEGVEEYTWEYDQLANNFSDEVARRTPSQHISPSDGVNNSRGVHSSNGVNYSDGVHNSNGINYSDGVHNSCGVHDSDGVNSSHDINCSDGINNSRGVNDSFGVNSSDGVNNSCGVHSSRGVNDSFGVNGSNGVNNSHGVHNSNGINNSDGVHNSRGVHNSCGIHDSDGVNDSHCVNDSFGVNGSNGINNSHGVNNSHGINNSDGVHNSFGVNGSLFVHNFRGPAMIFNLISTPERVAAISRKYHELCGDWRPTYSNLKSLYIKNGKDWEKTPIKDAAGIQRQEAWADMPQAAIDYLRTLPEFDPEIFFQITGHDYTVLEEG